MRVAPAASWALGGREDGDMEDGVLDTGAAAALVAQQRDEAVQVRAVVDVEAAGLAWVFTCWWYVLVAAVPAQ